MCDALLGDETIEELDLYSDNEKSGEMFVDVGQHGDLNEFHLIEWVDRIEEEVSMLVQGEGPSCSFSIHTQFEAQTHTKNPWKHWSKKLREKEDSQQVDARYQSLSKNVWQAINPRH